MTAEDELTPKQAEAARRANLVPQLRERSEYLTRYSNSPDDGLMSAAADEIERLRADVVHYKAMFESAAVSMDSCACQWEPHPDDPAEHTDRIVTLCLAHQEYFAVTRG